MYAKNGVIYGLFLQGLSVPQVKTVMTIRYEYVQGVDLSILFARDAAIALG